MFKSNLHLWHSSFEGVCSWEFGALFSLFSIHKIYRSCRWLHKWSCRMWVVWFKCCRYQVPPPVIQCPISDPLHTPHTVTVVVVRPRSRSLHDPIITINPTFSHHPGIWSTTMMKDGCSNSSWSAGFHPGCLVDAQFLFQVFYIFFFIKNDSIFVV